MVAYDVLNSDDSGFVSYVLGYEDLPFVESDKDYNDMVVKITVKSCGDIEPINHRPVITLIGANPATINVGENYIDPGATAFDIEDGDITSDIIASSTVNTAVAGTYTVTYNVSDSQG